MPRSEDGRSPGAALARVAGTALALLVPAALLGAIYLSDYWNGVDRMPVGFDTPKYVWRSNLAAWSGLGSLEGSVPPTVRSNPDRPGYPALAAAARAALGLTPIDLAFVLPAAVAAAIGLAAGAFALRALEEPPWAFPLYAIAVGASLAIARTATGYADNLLVDVLAMGAAATAVAATARTAPIAAPLLLVAASVPVHWLFAGIELALIAAFALALAPASILALRRGERAAAAPAARAGAALLLSAAGAAAVAWLIALRPALPDVGAETVAWKNSFLIDVFRMPVAGPLAVAGAVALLWPRSPLRRRGLLFALGWAGITAVGLAAFYLLGREDVPVYRLVQFSIGVPLLAAGLFAFVPRIGGRKLGPAGAVVGAAIAVVAVLAWSVMGMRYWQREHTSISAELLAQVATAGSYAARVAGDRPVVFVSGGRNAALQDHLIRAGLPPEEIPRAVLYLGDVEHLLAGEPTLREGDAVYNRRSLETWPVAERALEHDPLVLVLTELNPRAEDPTGLGREVAPGVIAVRDPAPVSEMQPASPMEPPSRAWLAGWAAALLLLFAAAGLGWSASLVPGSWLARLGLAPAFGLAVLVLAEIAVDRAGGPMTGSAGAGAIAASSALGWLPVGVRFAVQRRSAAMASSSDTDRRL